MKVLHFASYQDENHHRNLQICCYICCSSSCQDDILKYNCNITKYF